MPLKVKLETEHGERIEEAYFSPPFVLNQVLPTFDDASYQCWRFIDPYGHATFNRLQMGTFIEELERINRSLDRPEQQAMLDRIRDLARQCQNTPHRYLKFYGD